MLSIEKMTISTVKLDGKIDKACLNKWHWSEPEMLQKWLLGLYFWAKLYHKIHTQLVLN